MQNSEDKSLYLGYVDEAGDEGFKFDPGRSSEWFFLTGVIVHSAFERQVSSCRDEILNKGWANLGQEPPSMLHWRECDHGKKVMIVRELADKPFTFMTVCLWKTQLDRAAALANKTDYLFRYACRFLLERMSWYVDDHAGWLRVTFSNRNRFETEELQDYIGHIVRSDECQIRPVIDPQEIRVRANGQIRMLQIADACAGATFNAFIQDKYGNCQPYYLLELKERLYRYPTQQGPRVFGYGLKMFPDKAFLNSYRELYPFCDQL